MFDLIVEIFSYPFMQKALIVGLLTGVISAVLGVSLVLKNYAMIGDGLSHVGFGTFAVAFAAGFSPIYFSIPIVILASFLMLKINEKSSVGGDAIIALMSSSALGIGVLVSSINNGMTLDIYQFMFGSILATTDTDVIATIILSIVACIIYLVFYNKIFAVTFDESFARAIGINVELYRATLAVITSLVIVLGMRIIGAILISSLILFPPLTSFKLNKSFKGSIITSALLSFVSVLAGIVLSYEFNLPTGATIVVTQLAIYLVTVLVSYVIKKI